MSKDDFASQQRGTENAPVLVGMGIRLPGARTPSQMWRILSDGRCTIGTVDPLLFDPAVYYDPHKTRPGKTYSIAAGQIDDLYQFDAGFFGISPREAAQMDPQQRLMLQTTWEAVEDSGLDITDLAGDRTGVFVGSSIVENLSTYYFDTARGGSGFSLGNALNVIANRVSATFDFGGPSYVLDAACSSGLYALHQAAEALARDELDTAIVGAVHVIRAPGGFVGFSQARMMSPTGVCRAFDAGADGYVRSEACVALVLQRPQTAARMMARRRLLILSTGVNTDGGASPLTVPSAARQEKLIDQVLERSGRDPEDFAFYEAHGTGTQVGDPVEATSIGNALGKLRRAPLLIGSAKTNFGHPEPAAGLVGLAKTLLAMEQRRLPASLHFKTPNPDIDFETLNLEVNVTSRALADSGALVAGLNSFGFGGTNVAAIVESIPSETTHALWRGVPVGQALVAQATTDPRWLLLSAASQPSLKRLAADWRTRVSGASPQEQAELAAAVARSRKHLPHRLALPLGGDLALRLGRFAQTDSQDGRNDGAIAGRTSLFKARTVFAFAGNGGQYVGMGRLSYDGDPIYRQSFEDVAQAFEKEQISGLAASLFAPDLVQLLLDPLVAQPLLFACQIAQVARLGAVGLIPDAVIGHSVGEIAALHVAGAFDLAAAVRIIASRSRALADLRGTGTMAAVSASESDLARALAGLGDPALAIAAVNSPRSVTVAGPVDSLKRLGRVTVAGKRMAMVRLDVDVPYHSPAIDPLQDRFLRDLGGLTFTPLRLPVAGAAVGRMLRLRECDAGYLWRNVRDTVRFADALTALAEGGPCHIVEISPKLTFGANIRDIARFSGQPIEHFAPDSDAEAAPAHTIAARAWVQGIRVKTTALAGEKTGPAPDLPAYPWDETRHFLPLSPDGLDAWGEQSARRLVGRHSERAAPVWMAEFSPLHPSWVADHKVAGQPVLPAAALVEMALGAGADMWPEAGLELCHFDIVSPALVAEDGIRIRTMLDPDTGDVTLWMRPRLVDVDWTPLARGTLRKTAVRQVEKVRVPKNFEVCAEGDLYRSLSAQGIEYGPAFRRVEAQRKPVKQRVWVRLSATGFDMAHMLDPTSVDAGFQGLAILLSALTGKARPAVLDRLDGEHLLLPVRVARLRLVQAAGVAVLARVDLCGVYDRSVVLDLTLVDADQRVVAQLHGVEFALAPLGAGGAIGPSSTLARDVRLRLPAAPVTLPRGWTAPKAVLRRIGLRQVCAPGRASAPLAALRRAVVQGEGQVQAALAEVLRIAPDLGDDLRAMMLEQRGEPPFDVALHGVAQRSLWDLTGRLVDHLAQVWPKGERLNILLDALPHGAQLRRFASNPAIDRVSITRTTPEGQSLLRQTLSADFWPLIEDAPRAGSYDLVIALGAYCGVNAAAGECLAPGGLHLTLDLPDLHGGIEQAEGAWYLSDPLLPVRLRFSTTPVDGPAPEMPEIKVRVLDPAPDDLVSCAPGLSDLQAAPDTIPTHRLLVHAQRPGEDVSDTLVTLLGRLKSEMAAASDPLVIICLQGEDPHGFDQLTAGLGAVQRTLANEHPDRRTALICVKDRPADTDPAFWAQLLALSAQEPFITVTALGLLARRYVPLPLTEVPEKDARLDLRTPGRLNTLHWTSGQRKKPGPGEVEIAVSATGLNFRDVMWARGLLPERMLRNGASGAGFGMEYAGEILRVGNGTSLQSGTQVMGFAALAFATTLTVPETAVLPVPDGVLPVQAAALPVVFTTAWEALVRLARVQPGETVLIHGAAGGVGLAAIQIARMQGARVFATAGTPEKRAIARALGAEVAFDSRDPGFGDAVGKATEGRGVDVVLNSLSGAAMQRSVECLAPFGRFVELGKRDFLEGTRLDLRPFAANLSYFAYDLDQRLAADPQGVAATLSTLRTAFAKGDLRPLPVTRFPAAMAEDAFRHMLAARHVGKIVIAPPRPVRAGRKVAKPAPVRDDWVILGGTGGVGLAVAQALRDKGAGRVHLLSRSGRLPLASGAMGRWAQGDPEVILHAIDAADPEALGAFFTDLRGQGRRVGGVIHAAMILRDRLLRDLDGVEARQVIRAKLGVAQSLDQVLRAASGQPDHVICFSSVAASLGNPGQIEVVAEFRTSC